MGEHLGGGLRANVTRSNAHQTNLFPRISMGASLRKSHYLQSNLLKRRAGVVGNTSVSRKPTCSFKSRKTKQSFANAACAKRPVSVCVVVTATQTSSKTLNQLTRPRLKCGDPWQLGATVRSAMW